jgi:hypothetical protein
MNSVNSKNYNDAFHRKAEVEIRPNKLKIINGQHTQSMPFLNGAKRLDPGKKWFV